MPIQNAPSSELAIAERRPLLGAKEVAERLGMSLRTVRRLIAAGELPAHRIGRTVRVSEDDLARFLRRVRQ